MKKKSSCNMIAIWHSIHRKDTVLEANLYGAFLSEYFPDRIIISNSLYKGGKSTVSFYANNILTKKKVFTWVKYLPDVLRYVTESILCLIYLCKYGRHKTLLSLDPLSSLAPCILKKMGYVKKVIFVSLDYSTKRFNNPFLNRSYFLIDKFCTGIADTNVCSAQTVMAYKRRIYPDIKNEQFHMPNIPPPWIAKKYQNTSKITGKIVYVGHLGEGVNIDGFKELFKVVESFEKEIPFLRLFIVGDGDRRERLIELAAGNKNIIFLGHLSSEESVMKEIAESEIGIAMYNGDNCYDEFRDSVKIREYQSCGTIPITTHVARSNAEEILKYHSGVLVKDFTFDDLKDGIMSIMRDEQLKHDLRSNSIHNFEIYKTKYEDLFKLINE